MTRPTVVRTSPFGLRGISSATSDPRSLLTSEMNGLSCGKRTWTRACSPSRPSACAWNTSPGEWNTIPSPASTFSPSSPRDAVTQ